MDADDAPIELEAAVAIAAVVEPPHREYADAARPRWRRCPSPAPRSPTRSSSPTACGGTFGGVVAVDVDHLEVQRGSITALIGPNGAGKTTFFNLLTGFDEARLAATGRSTATRWTACRAQGGASRHGAHVPADEEPHEDVGHREHEARATGQRGEHVVERAAPVPVAPPGDARSRQQADELLAHFRLDHMRDEYAGTLSGGQRKLLEMARALMTNPQLVMLDEPMAGVNPALKQSLNTHIKDLRDEGMTVLFVEHDMDMVHDISDWVDRDGRGPGHRRGHARRHRRQPGGDRRLPRAHQGKSLLDDE